MKELIYKQNNPQLGKIKGVLRVIGKLLYFKFNNNNHAQQMITNLQSRGAVIETGEEWISVNMFHNQDVVKLGEKEFDVTKTSDEDTEKILYNFYFSKFKEGGFEVE